MGKLKINSNPISRINVNYVPFCKTTEKLRRNISECYRLFEWINRIVTILKLDEETGRRSNVVLTPGVHFTKQV